MELDGGYVDVSREVVQELCVTDPRSLASGGGASRLFAKFCEVGLVRQAGPTRLLTPVRNLELPRSGGVEAWHLFALFDCALECGHPSVIVDYVLQVCQDVYTVSSDPTESFLMHESLAETWCSEVALYLRREFISLAETVDPQDPQFLAKGLWIEKLLGNLQLVFEVLHAPKAPEGKGPLAEQMGAIADVLQACRTCNLSCSEGLARWPASGRYGSVAEWRASLQQRAAAFGPGGPRLFIEGLLARSNLGVESYPFASFLDAAKKIFLSPKAEGRQAGAGDSLTAEPLSKNGSKVYLYYLMDLGCTGSAVESFARRLGLSNAECAAVRCFAQLDGRDNGGLAEACASLPAITGHLGEHTQRVIESLVLLGRPQVALDIFRSRGSAAMAPFPPKGEALLIVDIHLSCKGLYEAFLYCQELWKKVADGATQTQTEMGMGAGSGGGDGPAEGEGRAETVQECTRRLCGWSEAHGAVDRLMELPFTAAEEACLRTYFEERLFTSASGAPLWPLFLALRRRYKEARAAMDELQAKMDQQGKVTYRSNDVYRFLNEIIDTALGVLPAKDSQNEGAASTVENAVRKLARGVYGSHQAPQSMLS